MQGSKGLHHSQQLFLPLETLKQTNRKNYDLKKKKKIKPQTMFDVHRGRKPGLSVNKTEVRLIFKDHCINGNS